MASLKEIRTRIASVKSTRQITSAMKMVSASKLKKAQDAILNIRPYTEKLQDILSSVVSSLKTDIHNIYAQHREEDKILLVLITSDRGLCGAFNSNAIKTAILYALHNYSNQLMAGDVDFFTIGKKGHDFLTKKGYSVIFDGSKVYEELTFERVASLAEMIMKLYVEGEYDRVDLVYNQFMNAGTQILTEEQFLPVKIEEHAEEDRPRKNVDYIFEPSKTYIVEELIPNSLKLQFFKALLDSHAAEFGARMTAMHKATDNATQLLKELDLQYNKARQASITKEILEIVSGAEALRG